MVNLNKKYLLQAKKIILNTNMLLSKNPDMISPNHWPTYFKKARNTNVTSLDGKIFLDMTCLVGHNTLGYGNTELNRYIKKVIDYGNMTSLNCPEEVDLTKSLLKIHKWAHMAKYTRSGGEANALAIRIARCSSKNDNVAVCGYHGWHDWYLAANLKKKKNLKNHLFENAPVKGVPKKLKGTTFQFEYGDISQLKKINKKNKIGIVKMEVCRNNLPNIKFLKEIRKFTKKEKIILIFDECTTGFRYNYGGIHLTTGVKPDLAIFGKAIGNGHAINAVIGKKEIMIAAKNSFISSTFWSERVGFAAALKTLEIMKKKKHWIILNRNGNYLRKKLKEILNKSDFDYQINNFPPIVTLSLKKNNNLFKSFLTKEMLKKKILATNIFYINIFHTKHKVDKFLKHFEIILKKFKNLKIKKYDWVGQNIYIDRAKD
jgi:glutamate-1-semialdehyde 2,1-aminomutase